MNNKGVKSLMITGGTQQQRRQKAYELAGILIFGQKEQDLENAKKTADLVELTKSDDEKEISIEQIRESITNLQLQPSKNTLNKVLMIAEFNQATHQAQNCLLKTLEEPPEHAAIVITCPHPKTVLPTIASRCHQIKVKSSAQPIDQSIENEFNALWESNLAFSLDWLEKNAKLVENKNQLREKVGWWLAILRKKIRGLNTSETDRIVTAIEKLYLMEERLQSQASPRLLLDAFFIAIRCKKNL
ncbi:hypothetical protein COT52_00370 [candidate division WWE3 bacterium CG08_land_8_20_14_0_20_43_13]|uniref:DNA polymerase III subunit delta n=1 Tax=candidate division WWE3 bacterium CG08_land_8_20_14_0_20_43_13 TaxID=1975087 RepID=A0A2H0XAF8_UNCKA|nr:MAG: hypothetical protein COT52_00370 [candidate division WWE3 bacterium CG08_land_8_20_14_0_20_43_13]